MKPNKRTSEELNSGLLEYGVKKTVRDEKKAVIGNRFVRLGFLKYKTKYFKHEDFTNYFGLETRVDLKIKVYKVKDLEMTQLIRIDNAYFDIVKMDDDLTDRFTYLYLQKRGGLDD